MHVVDNLLQGGPERDDLENATQSFGELAEQHGQGVGRGMG